MKSKWWVYARIASGCRGSHSWVKTDRSEDPVKFCGGQDVLTFITPSSSPDDNRCGVRHFSRLIGALRGTVTISNGEKGIQPQQNSLVRARARIDYFASHGVNRAKVVLLLLRCFTSVILNDVL